MPLSEKEKQRYARHLNLSQIGEAGQQGLKKAKVLCVGAGGIGSPAALYLAASGVGEITIIDFDTVELSNLQRQILFNTEDMGKSKVGAAKARLEALNDTIKIKTIADKLDDSLANTLIPQCDLVLDGSDNFETRYLVADQCKAHKVPLVSASIYQFTGQLIVLSHEDETCYRCLYPEAPPAALVPNCSEAGVLGAVAGVMGTLAAVETIKYLLQLPEAMQNAVLDVDCLRMQFHTYPITVQSHTMSRNAYQCDLDSMTLDELKQWQAEKKPFILIDVRSEVDRKRFHLPNDQHIPLDDIHYINPAQFTSPVVVYCDVGLASQYAVRRLKSLGVKKVYNLKNGLKNQNNAT